MLSRDTTHWYLRLDQFEHRLKDWLESKKDPETADGAHWLRLSAESTVDDDAIRDEASRINERVAGWQYRIADSRADRLARRWDDLLQAVDDDE